MVSDSQLSNSQLPGSTPPASARRRRFRSLMAIMLGVGISAAAGAGCAKARAATVPDGPPLAMPQPPPRVFAPVDPEEPLAANPVVPEPPAAEAPQVTPRRPPRRATTTTTESEKPEPTPQPTQTAPEPQRELRAASTPADADADKKIRSLLAAASRNLGQVDYQKLSLAGREQYENAKSFGEQANEALTQRNYVFAETLADKAAKLAIELLGR
jgi:hypothetical protein